MAKKLAIPNSADINELLHTVRSKAVNDVTQALRTFERTFQTYPSLESDDAERVLQECSRIVLHESDATMRYNALRLLKYAVTTDEFLRTRAEDVWALYKKTIFDPDGHVRNAGIQLMNRLRFGMTMLAEPYPWKRKSRSTKKMEERNRFQKMFVEQCIELFDIEKKYREEHVEIREIQEELSHGHLHGSWDTKDIFLKTIRRGLEEVTRYADIPELAKKHGYELPHHWLFENDMSEEIDMQKLVGDDIAEAMLHPGKSEPVLVSDPPDPKSFSSFEEYKGALDMREHFLDHVQAVNHILASGKSQEDIDEAMEMLGYEKHDDAPCNRMWCIERYGCVAQSLLSALQDIEHSFLEDPPTRDQLLLTDKEVDDCRRRDCHALPQEWLRAGSRSHTAFRWFMDLIWALEWNERRVPFSSLAKDPLIAAFVREAYWFTLSVLRKRQWLTERQGGLLIEKFLEDNDLVRAEDGLELRKTFLLLRRH